ncbi:MAG TPA: hypothetical protein VH597_15685 [Verrucomicrobiae bacterium]|jgi:hypothetical protein|nr:hypothetical protein [Verrucomicrobiae bacterium]
MTTIKKPIAALTLATLALLLAGCVPINYTRSVTVHKDAAGNITGTDEVETITEAHQEGPKIQEVKGEKTFHYLK